MVGGRQDVSLHEIEEKPSIVQKPRTEIQET